MPQPLSQAGRYRPIRHAQPHYQQSVVLQLRARGGVHRLSGVYSSNLPLAQLLTAVRAAGAAHALAAPLPMTIRLNQQQKPILAQGDLVTIVDDADADREVRFI